MMPAVTVIDLVRKIETLTDPWCLVVGPALELQKVGWKVVALPPMVGGGMVSLTLNSVEFGMLFVAIMVPLAAFFYWLISNLRRVRRTLLDIDDTLSVMAGRDPAVMKRIQDAHRERLSRRAAR
ncbi:MAG TPA: hypothetical protein VGK73_32430 [Polyangiaceae bacterium]